MTKKVLIVEDNESYAAVISQKFTHEQFDVMVAPDGHEGLQMAMEKQPDIILIDLLLPKMNGLQLMDELRNNDWGKKAPLLILTNLNPDDEIASSISRNKPAYYLVKPQVTVDDIVEKVKSILAVQ